MSMGQRIYEAGCICPETPCPYHPTAGEPEGRDAPPPEVTRIEVIDHRRGAPNVGRVFSAWNARVELSYQDGGRTLKVFVDGDATTENVPPTLLSDEARAERYAAIRADRLARGSSQAGSAPKYPHPWWPGKVFVEQVAHAPDCSAVIFAPGAKGEGWEPACDCGAGSAGSPAPRIEVAECGGQWVVYLYADWYKAPGQWWFAPGGGKDFAESLAELLRETLRSAVGAASPSSGEPPERSR